MYVNFGSFNLLFRMVIIIKNKGDICVLFLNFHSFRIYFIAILLYFILQFNLEMSFYLRAHILKQVLFRIMFSPSFQFRFIPEHFLLMLRVLIRLLTVV